MVDIVLSTLRFNCLPNDEQWSNTLLHSIECFDAAENVRIRTYALPLRDMLMICGSAWNGLQI